MSSGEREEVEDAVRELEELARQGAPPERYDARALLLPLGRALRGEGEERLQAQLDRARRAAASLGSGWQEAVQAELALACAEHIHSVDPRFLELANYDFAYTEAARERLEDRLAAARALGHTPPATLLAGVRRADRLLEPHLRRWRERRNS